MPALRAPRPKTRARRHALLLALGLLSLLGFVVQASFATHSHSHRHPVAPAIAEPTPDAVVEADHEHGDEHEDEHGHRHSGDPDTDLRTLGHTHVGGASPGLPPTLWLVAAAPQSALPTLPANDRQPGDRRSDNPFRPPIA